MKRLRKTEGFGYDRKQEQQHYVVTVPRDKPAPVTIHETTGGTDELRCILSRDRWNAIVDDLSFELNRRLRNLGFTHGRFRIGATPIARLLGKELLLLAWAMEDADLELAPAAVANWRGLQPEERWWLYTMTAAQTRRHDQRRIGWRKAVRYALTENPFS